MLVKFVNSVRLVNIEIKDAGFVYEYFRNETSNLGFLLSKNKSTKWIFQKQTYESNPRYKS